MKQLNRRLGLHVAALAGLYFGLVACTLAASEAGTVMNMDGSLSARSADGALRALSVSAKVLSGDTLFTGRESYARVKFADGGEISLRPGTQFKVEEYHYDEKQPEKDSAGFNLLKGGLRAVSGLIGKRGDPDGYRVKTLNATAGIRGTHFGLLFCQKDCVGLLTPDGKPVQDGLHLDVTQGAVLLKNAHGSQIFREGQFGLVKDAQSPPVIAVPEQGIKVEIPAKILEDRVKGVSDGKQEGARGADGKPDGKPEPSKARECPT